MDWKNKHDINNDGKLIFQLSNEYMVFSCIIELLKKVYLRNHNFFVFFPIHIFFFNFEELVNQLKIVDKMHILLKKTHGTLYFSLNGKILDSKTIDIFLHISYA